MSLFFLTKISFFPEKVHNWKTLINKFCVTFLSSFFSLRQKYEKYETLWSVWYLARFWLPEGIKFRKKKKNTNMK